MILCASEAVLWFYQIILRRASPSEDVHYRLSTRKRNSRINYVVYAEMRSLCVARRSIQALCLPEEIFTQMRFIPCPLSVADGKCVLHNIYT